jgi:hypothetical protein
VDRFFLTLTAYAERRMVSTTPTKSRKVPRSTPSMPAIDTNPRTVRSQARLELACRLIAKELESGEWISSNEVHRRLNRQIADGTFGRAKKELRIEHRRIRSVSGRAEYEWRLANK